MVFEATGRIVGGWVVWHLDVSRREESLEPLNISVTGMLKIEVYETHTDLVRTYLGKRTRDQRDFNIDLLPLPR
jgi:hypothetical protein